MQDIWDVIDVDTYLASIVNEDNIEEHLIQEARWKVSYRDTQFNQRGMMDRYHRAMELDERSLDWEDLGVSDQAIETLGNNGITQQQLHQFFAHPTILTANNNLFEHYRTLAGVSDNRLRDIGSVRSAVRQLRNDNQRVTETEELRRLCRFFNSLISTWASSLTDDDPEARALISVALTEGSAIEGSSRNAGGRKAVVNVGSVIVEDLWEHDQLESFRFKLTSGDSFKTVPVSLVGEEHTISEISGAYAIEKITATNGGEVAFTEPDMIVRSPRGVEGFGEIKDRKDTSNQWEGWLPLIRSKLEDFKDRNPDAKRIMIQPVYTERMIHGERGSDARDVGIRDFILEDDLLDVPFNMSQMLADEDVRDFFGSYIRYLMGLTDSFEYRRVPETADSQG
ncbi:hypothetical protein [Haloarchaeobius sp. HME9146]|uniref:hypothetical protein n=1 Tax=Haloarchaeobius sp. HME9146 TaxID=2978732 RepID=UPI0021BFD021|nr:hypothetical protein [Haloarchaeobius sp. HME9146]MCT9095162.1 hypothetical protein [Haloarchaeobius sp. HME9146]